MAYNRLIILWLPKATLHQTSRLPTLLCYFQSFRKRQIMNCRECDLVGELKLNEDGASQTRQSVRKISRNNGFCCWIVGLRIICVIEISTAMQTLTIHHFISHSYARLNFVEALATSRPPVDGCRTKTASRDNCSAHARTE